MPRGIPNKKTNSVAKLKAQKAKKEKKKVEVPTELPPVSAYEQATTDIQNAKGTYAEGGQTPVRTSPTPPTGYTRKVLCARLQELEAEDTLYKDQIALNRHKLDEIRSEIYRVEHSLFPSKDYNDNY